MMDALDVLKCGTFGVVFNKYANVFAKLHIFNGEKKKKCPQREILLRYLP